MQQRLEMSDSRRLQVRKSIYPDRFMSLKNVVAEYHAVVVRTTENLELHALIVVAFIFILFYLFICSTHQDKMQ